MFCCMVIGGVSRGVFLKVIAASVWLTFLFFLVFLYVFSGGVAE